MPCVGPLVENALRPPSCCGSAWQNPAKGPECHVQSCFSSRLRSLSPSRPASKQAPAPNKAPLRRERSWASSRLRWTARSSRATTSSTSPTAAGSRTRRSPRTGPASAASPSPTRSASGKRKELLAGILKSNPSAGSNEGKIANYYNAYLNTDAIDRAGLAPAKADLDAIGRHRRQEGVERRDRQHAPRRHRPAELDQFPDRESVRNLRHAGARTRPARPCPI